jgi:hypothetical protein
MPVEQRFPPGPPPLPPLPLDAVAVGRWRWRDLVATEHREFLAEQQNPPAEVRADVVERLGPALIAIDAALPWIWFSSVYRCPGLNAAIGGARNSEHMRGCAADVHFRCGLVEAFERIVALDLPELDQLIYEHGRWIHVGIAPPGQKARHTLEMCWTPGEYEPFNPADPRVLATGGSP